MDPSAPGTDVPGDRGGPPDADPSGEPGGRPSRRGRRTLWWVVGALVVVGLAAAGWAFRTPEAGTGQALSGTAPPIDLERLDADGRVTLEQFAGRPVVLNFFASWCVPCRKELPAFREVARRLEGRVAFVGVNHQDNRKGALELIDEFDVPYPSGFDPRGGVAADYGLFGMPSTVFVSPAGDLLERHTGELSAATLEAAIERLFGIRA